MYHKNPSFDRLLHRDFQLKRLVQQVDTLNQILDIVRGALPPEVANVCQGVAWAGTELMIAVPFSAAGTRLRQAAPDILRALDAAGWHATAIKPKVQVALQHGNPIQTKNLQIPEAAQTAIDELSQKVDDPALKAALASLLKHHRR
ncbi:DUF721 domain-containing protein [Deefgea piscis]|uniref:DUF721 domain-containing protein n=1 Tax=Deefgea piscis TaxID=2739061 RepID=A0A6M8SXM9_9NEIS|nr:DciA family protein [Deefgea piscis]QKJ66467.1 DUF721 domain-containing protein [Deefgea piscis]